MSAADRTLPGDGLEGRPSDQADPRLGRSFGQYRVLSLLNHGGTGVVYVGHDTLLDRPVALKFLSRWLCAHPRVVQRFVREAMVVGRLNHPNIICVYDLIQEGGECAIVLELLHEISAGQRLQRGPYYHDVATRIAADCCLALMAAHEVGVIHRDVKPDNVLYTNRGYVKLIDFGILKLMEQGQSLSGSSSIYGTPHFMSPEQALRRKVDVRSDVYSLGAMYYALLTGWPPFPAKLLLEILQRQVSAPTPDPRTIMPTIPEVCARVIVRAMQKDPDLRYQTATDMSAALEAILSPGSLRRASIFALDEKVPPPAPVTILGTAADNPFWGRAVPSTSST